MYNYVGKVMTAWVHTVKLDVRHVRQPGDRVPVGCVNGSKGPDNVIAGYAARYMGVTRNVGIIIEYELAISSLHING
jgi:hypothetical protein